MTVFKPSINPTLSFARDEQHVSRDTIYAQALTGTDIYFFSALSRLGESLLYSTHSEKQI